MFKSLQARLILSYVVIILVCLVLVGLAALVLLRGYQRELTFTRLADRSTLAARLIADSLRRGQPPLRTVQRLGQTMSRAGEFPIAVYLLDPAGHVVTGTNDRLAGLRLEDLALTQLPLEDWPIRGEHLAAWGRLLYVAEPVFTLGEDGQRAPSHVLLLAEPYRPVRAVLGDLLRRLLWAGVVALAASIVIAGLMAYSIARPLDRIARATEEIAAGNYDHQLDISTPTEVARLAGSFNSMALQVKAALLSQRDLIANVSHDLKTPLTSIQGFSQALLDGTASDEDARQRALTIVHGEAGRMRRLVDDLLDLARLEGGQVTLAREPVDMGGLLQSCAARLAPQSEEAGVALVVELAPALPSVVGDADRMGQVFANLVDNALKHAGQSSGEGRVVLRAEPQDGTVVCSVTDNGPGIPPEDLSRIFERFYQVDKSRSPRRSGAGLGLAIAQEIVHAHGGQILAESVEGLGTRFTVELPTQT
jgi:two-component system OmpR family sensor kinase